MAERVEDPAEPPTVFFADRRRFRRACGDCPSDDCVGVVHHERCSAGCAVYLSRAETLHDGRGWCDPERRAADFKLRDDVVPFADAMNDGCAERGLIEQKRLARAVDPQLRLDLLVIATPCSVEAHDNGPPPRQGIFHAAAACHP